MVKRLFRFVVLFAVLFARISYNCRTIDCRTAGSISRTRVKRVSPVDTLGIIGMVSKNILSVQYILRAWYPFSKPNLFSLHLNFERPNTRLPSDPSAATALRLGPVHGTSAPEPSDTRHARSSYVRTISTEGPAHRYVSASSGS